MKIGVAQVAPVLLDRASTLAKVEARIEEAGAAGCKLVVFGEALIPGYPVWLDRTHASRFNDSYQKEIHARYLAEAVSIERADLAPLRDAAKRHSISVVVGIIERPVDRGGHSAYCSCVFISEAGNIESVHRKLMPTYEERLAWSIGDGHGLVVHRVGPFTVGALNCWENWMPLARAALYAQGEDLHVMLWPGGIHNTEKLTPVVAMESRSYVVSVCGLLGPDDIPDSIPGREQWAGDELLLNGGSCVAGPDGKFIAPPVVGKEALLVAELDPEMVRRERQNFDPSGHYSRPDVLSLSVDRRRQKTADFRDD